MKLTELKPLPQGPYEELEKIINDTLDELPETYDIGHTPENIPELVRYWVRSFAEEREKRVELETIIKDTLRVLPVGNINTHTPDTIPERVQDWIQEAADECRMREKWEELADSLIEHARTLRGSSLMWGHEEWYEDISEDIKQYEKLKSL